MYIELLPTIAVLPDQDLFTFTCPSSDLYIDLSETFLRFTCRLTTASGAPIAAGVDVAPINMLGYAFLKQYKMFANATLVYDS
jgi:hypothetical protein